MTLFLKQIPALYNGVSQQPATLRLPSQLEAHVNGMSSVVDGIAKRPPSEHVVRLSTFDHSTAHIHTLNRDTAARYTVVITNGDLRVFDLEGNEKPVDFPHGKTYLLSSNPRDMIACVSVADYTFVVNKGVTVTMGELDSDTIADPADYWWLNRQEREGRGIASTLNYVIRQAAQRQYLANFSGGIWRGEVQSFARLPDDPFEGDIYKIKGTTDSNFTSYYVRRKDGVWTETKAPGLYNKIDATTMPHALVRLEDGSFAFGPFSWAPRRVGDEDTNANPTFVGRQIRDVFFYKNRLGLLTDENVCMSAIGDYGNYYRLTVVDLLSDGPIDIAVATTKVSILNFAVAFNSGMMAFSDQTQFFISSTDGTTTGQSLSADVTTQYECSKRARPVAIGSDIYFASENGDNAILWEYFVRDSEVSNDASNITAHCPKFIPAGVTKLASSQDHDMLFVLSEQALNRVYVYKFYWQGEEKAQSSWGYWEFEPGDAVLNVDVLGQWVYMLIQRDTGLFLERMSLQAGRNAPGLPFQVYLDRRTIVTGTYLASEDKTEFLLPYIYSQSHIRLIMGGGFGNALGALIPPELYEWTGYDRIRVAGNYAGAPVLCGSKYDHMLQFSEQFVSDKNGVAINTGRCQLRSMTVYYVDAGYFRTEVDPYGDNSQTETVEITPSKLAEFTGKTLGSASLVIGQPAFHTGAYQFQLYAPSTSAKVRIVNGSHVGATFQKAEVEMFYFNRSRT